MTTQKKGKHSFEIGARIRAIIGTRIRARIGHKFFPRNSLKPPSITVRGHQREKMLVGELSRKKLMIFNRGPIDECSRMFGK